MYKKRLAVIATHEELKLLNGKMPVVITGVGALNVINALQDIPRTTPLYNIGYAGSRTFAIGEVVTIGNVRHYHPNVSYAEPSYELPGDVVCYTNNDFVLETKINDPCVFDMELAYIMAMGFTDVIAKKVISDNLDIGKYNETIRQT